MARKHFGFGSGPVVAPAMTPDEANLNKMVDLTGETTAARGPVTSADFIARPMEPAAAQAQGPGFLSVLDQWLNGSGTWADAKSALAAKEAGARDMAIMRELRNRAALGDADAGKALAVMADTQGYAQAMNKNYEPRAVPEGQSVFGFGKPIGMAPKTGMQNGVGYTQTADGVQTTGDIGAPRMTDAEAAKAANDAAEVGLKALLTPAQMLHLDRTGRAALISANKQPAGQPTGWGGFALGPAPGR